MDAQRLSRSSVISGIGWQYASVTAQVVLQTLVLIVLGRLLPPEDFGVIGIATIFIGLIDLASEFGAGQALIQHTGATTTFIRAAFTVSILSSLLLTLLMIVGAPYVAHFFNNDALTLVLQIISLSFLFSGPSKIPRALLVKELRFKVLMWTQVTAYFGGYALVGIGLAWGGFGVWSLVFAKIAQSMIASMALVLARPHAMKPLFRRDEIKRVLSQGSGFTLMEILNYASAQADYAVVGYAIGTYELGIYTRSYQLMTLPANYVGRILQPVLFPSMAKVQTENAKLIKFYLTAVSLIAIICLPLTALTILLAPEIVNVLLGVQWQAAVIPLQILALGLLFRTAYKIDDSLGKALGGTKERSVIKVIYLLAVIGGSMAGLPWGLTGVASGVLTALTINHLLSVHCSLQQLKLSWLDVLRVQLPALQLSLLLLVTLHPLCILLRTLVLPSIMVLILVTLASALVILITLWCRPATLGNYGAEALLALFQRRPIQWMPWNLAKQIELKLAVSHK